MTRQSKYLDVLRAPLEFFKKPTSKLTLKDVENFEKALDDDLDISLALASVFELVKEVNKLITEKRLSSNDSAKVKNAMLEFDKVLGVIEEKEEDLPEELQNLIDEREKARNEKNFKLADKIRADLLLKGIVLEDARDGVRWKRA